MIPFCDRPGQSAAAGVAGGLLGGTAGLALGLNGIGVALLAGLLGGLGDLAVHVVRGDEQFTAAVERVREGLGGRA